MTRSNQLLAVIAAIVVLVIADQLIARYWSSIPASGLVSQIIVAVVLVYILGALLAQGRIRFPSLPKRRRMRVVKPRDPSKAAADFIKQFEDRAKR
ncbi:MAG TPA: hypothetical protein VHS78_12045 [Candidatus Elarobacter sp.]|jgi:hypothetical protein|nr:hypothetical protein [Candidatus Elarobacter sp.]